MNKMVRWALAFAAVMSVPTSAMALLGENPHAAFITNGPVQRVPVGVWRFTLDQLVDSGFDEACSFFVKWTNMPLATGAPFLPVTSANLFAEEVATAGIEDCDENSYFPRPAFLRLSPFYRSNGFDKFLQKRSVCNIMLGEDFLCGKFSGIIQFHPASTPYGFQLEPIGVP